MALIILRVDCWLTDKYCGLRAHSMPKDAAVLQPIPHLHSPWRQHQQQLTARQRPAVASPPATQSRRQISSAGAAHEKQIMGALRAENEQLRGLLSRGNVDAPASSGSPHESTLQRQVQELRSLVELREVETERMR